MGIVNRIEISAIEKWARENQVFIDVRSPGEFEQGHLPYAINAPILNNEERALVGTTYKKKGSEKAIQLGHEIVSGENRQKKIDFWKSILAKHPDAILTCFRGGQRSQITQHWLQQEGFDRPLISGGYKSVRQAVIDKIKQISLEQDFLLISGPTGAGKTIFLSHVESFWPSINLEFYAEHRGSAFGGLGAPQPQQAVFENRLGWDLFKLEESLKQENLPLIMEDESRLIGRSVIPESFFLKLRESPIIWLDIPLAKRVENTFDEYILKAPVNEMLFERYRKALFNIQRRLGGLKYKEVLEMLNASESNWKSTGELDSNKIWIESLLQHYYDPLYFGSLGNRNPKVAYKGSVEGALDFLKGQKRINKDKAVKAKAIPT